jgi:hypothetical protein
MLAAVLYQCCNNKSSKALLHGDALCPQQKLSKANPHSYNSVHQGRC